jgi:membrane protease YdiL (CAAX protease family)
MPAPRDRLRLFIEVAVYVILGWVAMSVAGWVAVSLGGYLVGITVAVLAAALFVNWLCLSIYERRPLADIGLHLCRASGENLLFGLAGGAASACLALAPGLLTGAAHWERTPGDNGGIGTFLFVAAFLAVGAAGEEILFRGYAFQLLIANVGPWATIVPVAILFAAMHSGNPNSSYLALANTAGFGVLFGYAFLRSRDLWLPIGLHFGWNFTLPAFGVNVSGLRMKMTGYELKWSAGSLWSGGDYGPEASILASLAMAALAVYLWRAPIRRQPSALLDPPGETSTCESGQPLPRF